MTRKSTLPKRRRLATPLPTEGRQVKSALRVLELLEFFDDMQRELTVMDVVRNLNYPQSSTTELLQTLVAAGFLSFNPNGRTYRPTVRVALLGRSRNSEILLAGPTLRLMERLSELTGETIMLATRNGQFAQYIDIIQATIPKRVHTALGNVRPLARSGTGYALLSTLSDDEVIRIIMRHNAYAPDDAQKVKQRDVLDTVATVRERGYAITRDLVSSGAAVIAAPLPTQNPGPAMVIGIGCPSDVLAEQEQVLVRTLFEQIEYHCHRPVDEDRLETDQHNGESNG